MKIDSKGRIVYGKDGMIRLAKLYYSESQLPKSLVFGNYICYGNDADCVVCEQFDFFLADDRKVIITVTEGGYCVKVAECKDFVPIRGKQFSYHVTGCPLEIKEEACEAEEAVEDKAVDVESVIRKEFYYYRNQIMNNRPNMHASAICDELSLIAGYCGYRKLAQEIVGFSWDVMHGKLP